MLIPLTRVITVATRRQFRDLGDDHDRTVLLTPAMFTHSMVQQLSTSYLAGIVLLPSPRVRPPIANPLQPHLTSPNVPWRDCVSAPACGIVTCQLSSPRRRWSVAHLSVEPSGTHSVFAMLVVGRASEVPPSTLHVCLFTGERYAGNPLRLPHCGCRCSGSYSAAGVSLGVGGDAGLLLTFGCVFWLCVASQKSSREPRQGRRLLPSARCRFLVRHGPKRPHVVEVPARQPMPASGWPLRVGNHRYSGHQQGV